MFNIVFLFYGVQEEAFFRPAIRRVEERYNEAVQIEIFDAATVDSDVKEAGFCKSRLEEAGFVCVLVHGGLPYFKRFNELSRHFLGKKPSFIQTGIREETEELKKESNIHQPVWDQLSDYFRAGGVDNYEQFLALCLSSFGKIDCPVKEVAWPGWNGLYGLGEGETEEERLIKAEERGKTSPIIGILIHYHHIAQQNLAHIDALMEAVQEKGGFPLAVYSNMMPDEEYGGLNEAMDGYFIRDGKVLIHALIVTVGHSLTSLARAGDIRSLQFDSVFKRLDVPVLQAMATFYRKDEWEESFSGMDPMMLCSCVYQPEFDGQIISTVIACTEAQAGEGDIRYLAVPLKERVDKVAGLALGWANLRRKRMEEKRVAIILHNMPPRADMIGCAHGLDTPDSVFHMAIALKADGLPLDREFESGGQIIQLLTNALTNDCRYLSAEEMLNRCERTVEKEQWIAWFGQMSEKVKRGLERDWGRPPGELMCAHDRILIPGIHNGSLFIGLQPPRAFEEKAEEAYHSTDLSCPYQYLAFYRYLREDFRADVLVHVGTHGTLEWLPGKETGLSESCYPDVAMGEIPHLYPYLINVPGEGAQAKRRSGAVILDHLIPSMTDSGLYGRLCEADEEIEQYYHAKINNPVKTISLARRIWEICEEQNLDRDIHLTREDFFAQPEKSIERLHLWLSGIKGAKIKNGLHRFGIVPPGQRYEDMLRLLVGFRNANIPSLREGICALYGWELQKLLSAPGERDSEGQSNAGKLERINQLGKEVFSLFAKENYREERIDAVIAALMGKGKGDKGKEELLRACLSYVAQQLCPRLNATVDELYYFLQGIKGKFVPQGPSGAPSRGNAQILPTGRNFFMIDPTAVPSRTAWETGKRLSEGLLQKHREETGSLPESIAIVVYSGECIKTMGDDIAEILYLYGVKPVWLAQTNRVIDLEVIPLSELGRPRIDVTLRVTGLFRDTFPNLIERIEDAVNLVASLDEPEEENYVKKHIAEDIRAFLEEGMDKEQAFEQARLRIFGCPPGTYGAGVDALINSKQWQASDELGEAYIHWGGHAYGKNIHGKALKAVFSKRLAATEVTVKNISSEETDMLDSDDFYHYHGGLISAVKAKRGVWPASYSTNAADPEHVVTRSVREDTSRIMRMRIANPKWVKGLREHGYKGAQELSAMADIVFGWDATGNVADDWMYDTISREYLFNDELREWIRQVNHFALHSISERLLEAAKRGMWAADEDTVHRLTDIYLAVEGDMEEM